MELSFQEACLLSDAVMSRMKSVTARGIAQSRPYSHGLSAVLNHTEKEGIDFAREVVVERRAREQIGILSSLIPPILSSAVITEKDRANMNRRLKPIPIRPKHLKSTYENEAKRLTRKV